MSEYLDLYDYRLFVANMYRERREALQNGVEPEIVLKRFRAKRNWLFAHHPQSALTQEQRTAFSGLNYFPYNPELRLLVTVDTNVEPTRRSVTMDAQRTMEMVTVGRVSFEVDDQPVSLSLYWLDIYGGGLFLPFRDTTSTSETYGGGRYLFDTIKGSDFLYVVQDDIERIELDFNYAYNPSCAYNDAYVCPLSPQENMLPVPIHAGEKKYR